MADSPSEFVPVFTPLAQEVGLVCAAVYGAVWRKCQMKNGNCCASLEKLGKELKVDRATMMRNIKTLCDSGYLIDQTPGLRNVPHTYILGKSVAECNTNEAKTVAENNSTNQTVAHDNATVAECNATVAESHLNRVFNRDSNKQKEENINSSLSCSEILQHAKTVLSGTTTRAAFEQIIAPCEARPGENGTFVIAAPENVCQQVRRYERNFLQALNQFTTVNQLEVINL